MPENVPPSGWGPASSDERDLDAVLAGQLADVPDALRPVADVLIALRAGPAPDELWGEARIMAEFRAHGPGGVARPAGPAPTRPLSVLAAGPSPRRRPARRHRRRSTRPVTGWAGALTGVAAAAAIVIVIAFTGNLPANIERLAHLGPTTKPTAASASTHTAAPKTETRSASVQPTTPPPATHSTGSQQSGPSAICREYYGDFTHPDPLSRLATEISLWRQLTALAGSQSPMQVYLFCAPHLAGLFSRWTSEFGQYPADPHISAGNQDGLPPGPQDSPGSANDPRAQNGSGGQNSQGAQHGLPPGQQPGSAGPLR